MFECPRQEAWRQQKFQRLLVKTTIVKDRSANSLIDRMDAVRRFSGRRAPSCERLAGPPVYLYESVKIINAATALSVDSTNSNDHEQGALPECRTLPDNRVSTAELPLQAVAVSSISRHRRKRRQYAAP
jgi:hypothetical protein